ncbi:MAG: LdpA C-terminal domain-containing domain, partial [Microcystaceae cyanobacterium]
MTSLESPLQSLEQGCWVKLICGASFQDLPALRSLAIAYSLAGVDCFDLAADWAVVTAVQEGMAIAQELLKVRNKSQLETRKPWLMISLNDGEDPHFRKAYFDASQCPQSCPRPCEKICPADAINTQGIMDQRCYGCGRCLPVCPLSLISTRSHQATSETITDLLNSGQIDALEIHTQVGNEIQFKQLWLTLLPHIPKLKLLAISCPDQPEVLDYLHFLNHLIQPLPCPLIWQTDGRPMSGDIGKGTT